MLANKSNYPYCDTKQRNHGPERKGEQSPHTSPRPSPAEDPLPGCWSTNWVFRGFFQANVTVVGAGNLTDLMPRVQTESQQRCLLLKFIIFSSIDSIKLTRVMAKHKSLATGPNKDGGGELKLTKEPAERDAKLTWIGPKCVAQIAQPSLTRANEVLVTPPVNPGLGSSSLGTYPTKPQAKSIPSTSSSSSTFSNPSSSTPFTLPLGISISVLTTSHHIASRLRLPKAAISTRTLTSLLPDCVVLVSSEGRWTWQLINIRH
ncbi:hypothetical protein BKA59DRAFT_448330 [Fusarium tricinctum]|uniref:Uncharacterized protein n=1 Tax=Fusarium tricinctum TaxID=61284 RepID=A0A8K0S950_9HYPO|nr:hypothetical protein BKA59DRAFT_448330 [Fusarium tricinctum]